MLRLSRGEFGWSWGSMTTTTSVLMPLSGIKDNVNSKGKKLSFLCVPHFPN